MAQLPATSVRRVVPRRRAWFAGAAISLSIVPFLLVELLLQFFDAGRPTRYADPFVGFSQIYPLFELDARAGEYRTSIARLHYFAPQRFAAIKPPHTFRVFCLGGSTVLGHPYQPDTAFGKWLELELDAIDPSQQYEVINCGGMSYASYRIIPILEEVLHYEPDLIILMTGHNEFLEDRTYSAIKQRSAAQAWLVDRVHALHSVALLRRGIDALRTSESRRSPNVLKGEVDAKLDHPGGYASYRRDDIWRAGVINHYRHNVRTLVRLANQATVPIVLVNPGANLRDCPPFKAEHRERLEPHELDEWTREFQQARAIEQSEPERALEHYRQAERIDGEHAQLVYRIARCLDRLQRHAEAREAYIRAKDLDVCPLRMLEPMHASLVAIAHETQTPLVDARALLEDLSPHRIAGHNIYVDQVHPSIAGHQELGRALVRQLQRSGLVAAQEVWSDSARRAAYARHLDALGDLYLAQGRKRVEFLENWARRDRMGSDWTPHESRDFLDLGHTYLEFAEYDDARAAYNRAMQLDSESARILIEHAANLFAHGRTNAAKQIALWTMELSDEPLIREEARTKLERFAAP